MTRNVVDFIVSTSYCNFCFMYKSFIELKNVALADDLTSIIKVNEMKCTRRFWLSTRFMDLHIITLFSFAFHNQF